MFVSTWKYLMYPGCSLYTRKRRREKGSKLRNRLMSSGESEVRLLLLQSLAKHLYAVCAMRKRILSSDELMFSCGN